MLLNKKCRISGIFYFLAQLVSGLVLFRVRACVRLGRDCRAFAVRTFSKDIQCKRAAFQFVVYGFALAGWLQVDIWGLAQAHIAGLHQFLGGGFELAQRVIHILQGDAMLVHIQHMINGLGLPVGGRFAVELSYMNVGLRMKYVLHAGMIARLLHGFNPSACAGK